MFGGCNKCQVEAHRRSPRAKSKNGEAEDLETSRKHEYVQATEESCMKIGPCN